MKILTKIQFNVHFDKLLANLHQFLIKLCE